MTEQLGRLRELVERRRAREPLAYVLGEWGFRRLMLSVDGRALVPRPETEGVVERCLVHLRGLDSPRVLDVGTGSGAIALAIADEHPGARVVAVDRADGALALARENLARTVLDGRVELRHGDLLEGLAGPFDLVVSNPPYVPAAEYDTLQPEIRLYEPYEAVVGDGVWRKIARDARDVLAPGGHLVLEVGDGQAAEVAEGLAALGYDDVQLHPGPRRPRPHRRRASSLAAMPRCQAPGMAPAGLVRPQGACAGGPSQTSARHDGRWTWPSAWHRGMAGGDTRERRRGRGAAGRAAGRPADGHRLRALRGRVPGGAVPAAARCEAAAGGDAGGAARGRPGRRARRRAGGPGRAQPSCARALLPGPYTLVLPNPARRFRWLTGTRPTTIGVRVPALPPAALEVVTRVGAVAATSANLHGEPDPARVEDMPRELLDVCGALVDAGELPGTPSTVIDLTGAEPVVLREGAVPAEEALGRAREALSVGTGG